MEKSTLIAGISLLAVAGMGTYIYLKGKKSTTTNSTVTTPTPPTDDIKALADLGVKIEEPKVTPYVAPSVPVPTVSLENIQKALLALGIDQTRGITELSSPNYIEAKKIAENIKILSKIRVGTITNIKSTIPSTTPTIAYSDSSSVSYSAIDIETLSNLYGSSVRGRCADSRFNQCALSMSIQNMVNNMTKKINSLGYKLLPDFGIEKM
jgi:hypothetical protein